MSIQVQGGLRRPWQRKLPVRGSLTDRLPVECAAPERLYGGAGTGGWCRGVCRSVAPPSTKIAKPPWGFLFLGGP